MRAWLAEEEQKAEKAFFVMVGAGNAGHDVAVEREAGVDDDSLFSERIGEQGWINARETLLQSGEALRKF
jgi:hypothetical protein